jgi:hypothetical protein
MIFDSIRIRGFRSRTTKKVGQVRYVLILSSVSDPGCLSRIPDVYPGSECFPSRFRMFFIPDPNFFHPGSRIRIKQFQYFNPENGFYALRNMMGCSSWIPAPDPVFCPSHFVFLRDVWIRIQKAAVASRRATGTNLASHLLRKLRWALKVPKREIFDRSDFPNFYTIKPSWVGDLLVKI